MEDDDIGPLEEDIVCARVAALRGIASDLETASNKDARRLLNEGGRLLLQHLELKSAQVVELATRDGKSVREQPL